MCIHEVMEIVVVSVQYRFKNKSEIHRVTGYDSSVYEETFCLPINATISLCLHKS